MVASRIKVALTGLSATAPTSWAQDAHLPYLLSPLGQSRYEVVALCGPTAAAAAAARRRHGLPDSVEAYGDAAELAADRGVDLVVCCGPADDASHYRTAAPLLRAAKAVYLEWPVADSLATAVRLAGEYCGDGGGVNGGSGLMAAAAGGSGSSGCSSPSFPGVGGTNNMVGLQGRLCPVVRKVKDMLDSGRVGRVLSSEVRAFDALEARHGSAADAPRAVSNTFGHTLDYVHEVLGEFEPGTMRCRMQTQRPPPAVGQDKGSRPDLVVVHGQLAAIHHAAPDATLSVTYRTGPPFKGQPGLTWTINCERGEIMITSPDGPYLHSESYAADAEPEQVTIRVHDFAMDHVINVHWDWEDWQLALPVRARSVAQLYERFARQWEKRRRSDEAASITNGFCTLSTAGVTGGGLDTRLAEDDDWPRIQDGIARLRQLDAMFRQYNSQRLG